MKRIFFVVLFLFSLIFSFYSPYSPLVFAHSDIVVVVMNENGFEPAQVTVDVNSAVLFVNKDDEGHWPASNIHPTHDLYPEFDSKQPIEVGKSWSFRPQNVGIWKYHDHLRPHFRGVITVKKEETEDADDIVEPKEEESQTSRWENIKRSVTRGFYKLVSFFRNLFRRPQTVDLSSLDSKQQIEFIERFSYEQGVEKAWQLLQEKYSKEPATQGQIHDLAHLVGSLLYKENGFSGIGICNASFSFGCYHGFLDTAFAKSLKHLKDAEKACLSLGPSSSGPFASCIHGVGHGIASFYSTLNLEDALETCNTLSQGKEFCHDGVFMEFVRGAPQSFYKEEDLFFPCSSLGKEYSLACGRNQPNVWIDRFKMSLDTVTKTCLESKENDFLKACVETIGFTLARENKQNIEAIRIGCEKVGKKDYEASCVKAAAGEFIFQNVEDWQTLAPSLCNTLEGEHKTSCQEYLEQLKREYRK